VLDEIDIKNKERIIAALISEDEKIYEEAVEKGVKLLAKLDELCPPKPMIRLKPCRAETIVFDSKMGGIPYFPKNMEYPTVREGSDKGKPLYLLAQLNFGTLPKIEGFPGEGILQIFAGYDHYDDDDMFGMDYNDRMNQNEFRVIFHEKVITDINDLMTAADLPRFWNEDKRNYPFKGEFELIVEETMLCSVSYDEKKLYNKAISEAYSAVFGGEIDGVWSRGEVKGLYQTDRKLDNVMNTVSDYECKGTHIGGYPIFVGDDPRSKEGLDGHSVLLFQSYAHNVGENGEDEINWGGNGGVAHFFITPDDLARRDFSKVFYTWSDS
ncbi:MAG: DUF1963 domain-containing protein, partial [Oscillospiraceae bacterium]|nr:DUF1963 domain-containing protein [Oscillospiraceae bacterium]